MPRNRNDVPKPRRLRNYAVLDVWRGSRRQQLTLGPWKSKQAQIEYRRFLSEYATGMFDVPISETTVSEMFLAFMKHAKEHYRRPDGTPTSEIEDYKRIVAMTRELYGSQLAREFGPLKLQAVRNAMIARGWCRSRINQHVGRLKRIFKWATSKEIIPATVLYGLQSLSGLQRGRSPAHDPEPIKPVDEDVVRDTLPFLTRHVAGMVRLQLLTGMRPGEVCTIRHSEIDKSDSIWVYRPSYHKLAYRNEPRAIPLGPKAQAVLAEFPTGEDCEFIFSPARSIKEVNANRTVNRATPKYRSHMIRNVKKRKNCPTKVVGFRYEVLAYGRAIAKAVKRINERREQLAGQGCFDPLLHWHPNQLRHLTATRLRKEHGIEAAQVILGHKRLNMTEIYAERNLTQAIKIAATVG